MDGRTTRLLAGVLLCGALGCLPAGLRPFRQQQPSVPKSTDPPPGSVTKADVPPQLVAKADDSPVPLKAKASTCVAFAEMRLQEANDDSKTDADRDLLRLQALKLYKRAIEVEPKYLPAYLALARMYEL